MAWLLAALMAVLGGATPSVAIAAPALPTVVHVYDGVRHHVVITDVTTRRGPPAAHDHTATYDAVDRRSHGASARPRPGTSPMAYTYNDPAKFAHAAHAAPTTREQAQGVGGSLSAFERSGVAAKGFATGADEAVFWSGVGSGGDKVAAEWVAKHGGATLETTMASRGITLPAWDAGNPAVVAAWRDASAQFARGASGNVRVLQGDAVRLDSVWAQVEFPALKANQNVTSITAINPSTGASSVIWRR